MRRGKIKLTRPELKRQREDLELFQRFLPMLKLRQQQLQITLQRIEEKRREAEEAERQAREEFEKFSAVGKWKAGMDLDGFAEPEEVRTRERNIAGVVVPEILEVNFPKPEYSLFATPSWVDETLTALRRIRENQEYRKVLARQYELVNRELTSVTQKVNLFEKMMIPRAQEAIRRIQIRLGEQMTSAIGRAKLAKEKLQEMQEEASEATGESAS